MKATTHNMMGDSNNNDISNRRKMNGRMMCLCDRYLVRSGCVAGRPQHTHVGATTAKKKKHLPVRPTGTTISGATNMHSTHITIQTHTQTHCTNHMPKSRFEHEWTSSDRARMPHTPTDRPHVHVQTQQLQIR